MAPVSVRVLLRIALVALAGTMTTAPWAGGLDTTWYASDPAKLIGMPAIITLDPSGSASFGSFDCRWSPAPLSLGDQKYCADACSNESIQKALMHCGADTIRLYCMDKCDTATVSVGNEYGQGQFYFTLERLRSGRRALPGHTDSQQ